MLKLHKSLNIVVNFFLRDKKVKDEEIKKKLDKLHNPQVVNVIGMEVVSENDCGNKIQLLKKFKIFQDIR